MQPAPLDEGALTDLAGDAVPGVAQTTAAGEQACLYACLYARVCSCVCVHVHACVTFLAQIRPNLWPAVLFFTDELAAHLSNQLNVQSPAEDTATAAADAVLAPSALESVEAAAGEAVTMLSVCQCVFVCSLRLGYPCVHACVTACKGEQPYTMPH